jgi:hypothetical protein
VAACVNSATASATRLSVDPRPPERPHGADCLVGPDDPERARRLAWADLFQRTFREDVLVCQRCGGEMRVLAVIEDPAVIEKVLRHLGLWQRGPPHGRHVVVDPADREPSYVDA